MGADVVAGAFTGVSGVCASRVVFDSGVFCQEAGMVTAESLRERGASEWVAQEASRSSEAVAAARVGSGRDAGVHFWRARMAVAVWSCGCVIVWSC